MSPVLDVEGPAAPPRSNGELVFAAPWESRAFGLVLTLVDAGRFAYEDFRARLVARIGEEPERPYWESWLAALQDMVSPALDAGEIGRRAAALLRSDDHHRHLESRGVGG